MTWAVVTGVCGAVFLATVVQQVSGFGFALLCVPLASLVVGPKDAVAVAMLAGLVSSGKMAHGLRAQVHRPELRRLLLGAALGLPIGVVGLRLLPDDPLRVALAVVVLTMVAVLAGGYRRASTAPRTQVAAGVLSGLLNGSLGTGGPPVIVLLQATGTEQHRFRATTTAFFATCDLAAIPLILVSGATTATGWWSAAASIPVLLVGDRVGHRLAYRIDRDQFARVVLGLLAVTAVVTLVAVFA
ncbi:sulfite exporter TauE/SafE family protein [Aquihabitans sp. G128]|uniref:sulfite exporter TauE/SafE family protein n=1 Tax=Aquihabitans sp. G128 TaxID=2849779 RepID=UPI001C214A32|nr:sulfite exporter TauE/SafE family protein [Aquihabitans sp. G128]QXC62158.1 sulfite exporter TauE/SafE family protein [Aquihabitans sp. G128]